MLIAAALADGGSRIENALASEDTELTMRALGCFGIRVARRAAGVDVAGCGGKLTAFSEPIDLGNSGTSMRLLAAVAALGEGPYTLTGNARMRERPIQDLLDALSQLGVDARALAANGCPPVAIRGPLARGGRVRLNCRLSSQFLSALLLIAGRTAEGLAIEVVEGPVSRPYVDLTLDTLERFGVRAERSGYRWFRVPGAQAFQDGTYRVEPDASHAGYFWAAAAVTGATVMVRGISRTSRQGDIRLLDILENMGCRVEQASEGVAVRGGPLTAVEVDMADMPDSVPTLAVVAAYARGTTVIRNVGHLRAKETDRLSAVVAELGRMGIEASACGDALSVTGANPRGARIETYEDHRMAMSFAVAGLKTPGVVISGESCVRKSFPDFWHVFDRLYGA
jgi:3-phosphoshikimate 1-carboxyvinyltransferase